MRPAKRRLTKSAMRRGLKPRLLPRSSREVSIGLKLNRTDTAGRAERVGLRGGVMKRRRDVSGAIFAFGG